MPASEGRRLDQSNVILLFKPHSGVGSTKFLARDEEDARNKRKDGERDMDESAGVTSFILIGN